MPRKLSAKTRALRRFKRAETKAGQKQDRRMKAPVVGIKDYDPKVNDYKGVDTPRRRTIKKSGSGNKVWKAMAAAALKEASRKYRAQKKC